MKKSLKLDYFHLAQTENGYTDRSIIWLYIYKEGRG